MRRRTLLAGAAVALAGCGSTEGSDALVDDTGYSAAEWSFDLAAGDTIEVHVEILQRPSAVSPSEGFKLTLSTVEGGDVAVWTFPFEDVEATFEYTAETDGRHTLYGRYADEFDVTVEEVDDD